jgi:hypothetical protein
MILFPKSFGATNSGYPNFRADKKSPDSKKSAAE